MRDDDDYSDGGSSPVLAFLCGAATGAVIALLYAPRSGQETRALLNEKLQETAERGREAREQLINRGRELLDEGTSRYATGHVPRDLLGRALSP
jgi:Gas vesicle protein